MAGSSPVMTEERFADFDGSLGLAGSGRVFCSGPQKDFTFIDFPKCNHAAAS